MHKLQSELTSHIRSTVNPYALPSVINSNLQPLSALVPLGFAQP